MTAMQETMISVLKHLRALHEPAAVQRWVRCIAVREALKLARARRALVPVEHLPERPADDATTRVEIADTCASSAPTSAPSCCCATWRGSAALLEVEVGTVKSRLHRARQAFRSRWQR
jgi:RNA polymerase sigma-70 factor (ECF subfamily)